MTESIYFAGKTIHIFDSFLFKEVDGPHPTPKEPEFISGNYYYSEKDSLIVLCDGKTPNIDASFSGVLISDPKEMYSVGQNRNNWSRSSFIPVLIDCMVKNKVNN